MWAKELEEGKWFKKGKASAGDQASPPWLLSISERQNTTHTHTHSLFLMIFFLPPQPFHMAVEVFLSFLSSPPFNANEA